MADLMRAYEHAMERSSGAAAAGEPSAASPARRKGDGGKAPATRTSGRKRARSPSPATAAAIRAALREEEQAERRVSALRRDDTEEEDDEEDEEKGNQKDDEAEYDDNSEDDDDGDDDDSSDDDEKKEAHASPAKRRRTSAVSSPAKQKKPAAAAKSTKKTPSTGKKSKKAEANEAAAAAYDPETSPVFDTCNEVRRKIRAHLRTGQTTIAAFLRECGKINSNSYRQFMAMKMPTQGSGNCLYPAAYHFFERRRIAEGKSKSKLRLESEEAFPEGHSLEPQFGRYRCHWDEVPVINRLGVVRIVPSSSIGHPWPPASHARGNIGEPF